jgi:shikimate dehydrogenase
MHNAALRAAGLDCQYIRLHISEAEFAEALSLLPSLGFSGVNCTIPHKPAALSLVHHADAQARRAGGVNTIRFEDNGVSVGTSTDGPGIGRAVREAFGVDLRDLRILVVGAGGGAGRAVSMQCAQERCEQLFLANRTVQKMDSLATDLRAVMAGPKVSPPGDLLQTIPLTEAALAKVMPGIDLVIQCTSLGMRGEDESPVPSNLFDASHLVYDTVYTRPLTPIMIAAQSAGARTANGLGMLLHQGVLAFEFWFGIPAPLEVMRVALAEAVHGL